MKDKIVIAGGTGFIGTFLKNAFQELGFEVLIISRHRGHVAWNNEKDMVAALEGASILVNLAGKSVDCRYTEKNKALILSSRVNTTRRLQDIVDQCRNPPQLWINSSTATIYRHAEDRPMDEEGGEIGNGFSVEVARAWEAAFFEKPAIGTRKVALRIAIALGRNGGVMTPFTNLVRSGLGGQQGNGRQMFSWIHVEDLFQIIRFVSDHANMHGVYNCSAPNPVTNADFMREMRSILKPMIYLPSPAVLLQVGAIFIRTETELILKSRWVIPKRLIDAGFKFRYPTIDRALEDILQKGISKQPAATQAVELKS